MNLSKNLNFKKEESFEKLVKTFSLFRSEYFDTFNDDISIKNYAEKILKYGYCYVCYLEDEPLGFFTAYANDVINLCAYGSILVVFENAGLLRGLVYRGLFESVALYAKKNKMKYMIGEVADANTNAKKQYYRLGFVTIGRASETTEYIKCEIDKLIENLSMPKGR